MELKLFELQKGFLFRYVKFSVVPKVSHFWSYRTRFLINWFVINKKRIQQHATYFFFVGGRGGGGGGGGLEDDKV